MYIQDKCIALPCKLRTSLLVSEFLDPLKDSITSFHSSTVLHATDHPEIGTFPGPGPPPLTSASLESLFSELQSVQLVTNEVDLFMMDISRKKF